MVIVTKHESSAEDKDNLGGMGAIKTENEKENTAKIGST